MGFRAKGAEGRAGGGKSARDPSVAEGAPGLGSKRVETGRASMVCWGRGSDSPYVESILHGRTLGEDAPVRPAESHWHMVFVRQEGEARVVFAGPWTTAGQTYYTGGAEILWIKFRLGAFMPHLPVGRFLDKETVLPGASSRSHRTVR